MTTGAYLFPIHGAWSIYVVTTHQLYNSARNYTLLMNPCPGDFLVAHKLM